VKRVIADGAYDTKTNFHDNSIEAAIKVRKNTTTTTTDQSMDCYPRKIVVLQQLKDFDKWKDSVSYGYRWMVETMFSTMKRMFGEHVTARIYPNMVKEMFLKASWYNMFNAMKI
jgi:hypothetical protein